MDKRNKKKTNKNHNRIWRNGENIDPILTNEVETSTKILKNGKATGPDEIPNEIFTKTVPQTIEIYKELRQAIAKNKDIPEQWQKGQIIKLYKGKGKSGKCSKERGITLASNFGKLSERVLNNRTKDKINLTENQGGGQKGKATSDHLAVLKEKYVTTKNQLTWYAWMPQKGTIRHGLML